MQRLFSIFPNGWPGAGLLLLRLASGTYLLIGGITGIAAEGFRGAGLLEFGSLFPCGLLLVGLWTPVAGVLGALVEMAMILLVGDDPKARILFICICVAIAMLGPGCWSIDSLLFGRRRLDVSS